MAAGSGHRFPARETVASAAQYVLLGGFASTAAGISAQGLTGFARSNMDLRGPWPYLLFFALDGAAGVCAVLLARRAARAESGLAPRLAVWGLIAASASFNWTHAPRRPAAAEAFGLMPVIAALLFEFCLREMRLRTQTNRADRRLNSLRWLHPAERVRVQICLAADDQASAAEATRRVRIDDAARRLYRLRALLDARDRAARPAALGACRIRRAQRRAHGALLRAGFTEPVIATAVLRQVQVLVQTMALARLDYGTPDAARQAIGDLIAPPPPDARARPAPQPGTAGEIFRPNGTHVSALNGHLTGNGTTPGQPAAGVARRTSAPAVTAAAGPGSGERDDAHGAGDREAELVAAARRIVADARHAGTRLSQIALAERLRGEGHSVANSRLRWLAAVSGLETGQGDQPPRRSHGGR